MKTAKKSDRPFKVGETRLVKMLDGTARKVTLVARECSREDDPDPTCFNRWKDKNGEWVERERDFLKPGDAKKYGATFVKGKQ